MKLNRAKQADKFLYLMLELEHQKTWVCERSGTRYSRVSFCDGPFYDYSLLQPLSIRTEHFRLVVRHCRNSSVFSVLSALLTLFRCACVSSFSVYCSSIKFIVIFPTHDFHQKDRKEEKIKTVDVTFCLDVF